MHLRRLWLRDFRSHHEVDLELTEHLCAVLGPNGVGKSNLLEAVGYLALLESFRGAPTEAMVRAGAEVAIVRGEVVHGGREQLIEAELRRTGPNRVLLNRQRLHRSRDLLGALRVVVFAPDDLALVKGGPALRRQYLDQVLVSVEPRNDVVRAEFERAVRQRNALLKQTRGRLDEAAAITLEVWNSKVVESGERLAALRVEMLELLAPLVAGAYAEVAGREVPVELDYEAPWRDQGLAARTHASQGEQRSLALALRLAAHRVVTERTGAAPLLLLDDVFSELDDQRAAALVECLPTAQTLLTSASGLPPGVHAEQVLHVGPDGVVAATG